MWRAFFFAIGTMLILLGLQCLVVERFEIAARTRIPAIVAKILDSQDPSVAQSKAKGNSGYGGSRSNNDFTNQFQQAGNYQNPNSQFSLAKFGRKSNNSQSSVSSDGPRKRIVKPKDWMPWSLLAAGTLVVLYTNTTAGRGISGE